MSQAEAIENLLDDWINLERWNLIMSHNQRLKNLRGQLRSRCELLGVSTPSHLLDSLDEIELTEAV